MHANFDVSPALLCVLSASAEESYSSMMHVSIILYVSVLLYVSAAVVRSLWYRKYWYFNLFLCCVLLPSDRNKRQDSSVYGNFWIFLGFVCWRNV